MLEQFYLLVIALAANFLSSLAGGGAGLLQLPALILLGLAFPVAMATHKVATVALGVGASVKHLRAGNVDWKFAGYILAVGLPAVILGSFVAVVLPERVAKTALGILTLGLSLYSWFKPELGQQAILLNRKGWGLIFGGMGLLVFGFLNGLLSSGTGLFVTLWLVRWFGLDYKQAVAYTMILVGIFWNGAGALTLNWLTPAQWSWMPALLLGSVVGGYAGAHVAIAKGNYFIKRVFEILTCIVGCWLLWHAWKT